ncbi:MAG: hypothetical protein JNL84_01405 [Candidatus Accumulibacter sp.]|nr:hypothetical protein [Accumulibacter sp.]
MNRTINKVVRRYPPCARLTGLVTSQTQRSLRAQAHSIAEMLGCRDDDMEILTIELLKQRLQQLQHVFANDEAEHQGNTPDRTAGKSCPTVTSADRSNPTSSSSAVKLARRISDRFECHR